MATPTTEDQAYSVFAAEQMRMREQGRTLTQEDVIAMMPRELKCPCGRMTREPPYQPWRDGTGPGKDHWATGTLLEGSAAFTVVRRERNAEGKWVDVTFTVRLCPGCTLLAHETLAGFGIDLRSTTTAAAVQNAKVINTRKGAPGG